MGMLNQQGMKEKIILVHSPNVGSTANFLQNTITSNPKYKNYQVAVFTDKQYKDNKFSISNEDYVIFIGNSKILCDESYGMNIQFNENGMQYGWLGNRAYLKFHHDIITANDFKIIAEEYKITDENIANKIRKGMEYQMLGGLLGVGELLLMKKNNDNLKEYIYFVIVQLFYKNGFDDFLGI